MSDSSETLWIGRVRANGREHVVRLRTDGRAPQEADLVEEIQDPFEVGRIRLGSGDEPDAWTRARAPALADGISGELGQFELARPVRARKVLGVGRNFRAHAEELGNAVPDSPLLFFKAPTCLLASGASISRPSGYERVDMEAELVVVIGRAGKDVSAEDAWQHIGGYTLGNDVSNRDLQKSDKQWTRAKGFDGFGPCGPFVRMSEPGQALPVDRLRVRGWHNGELVQDGGLDLLIFPIPELIAHISECMRLEPGDLIYTGTPAGVTALVPGDTCRVELVGLDLGSLENPVV